MPRCDNGHECGLAMKCEACGAAVSYREACEELRNLPRLKPSFEKLSSIYVGFPPIPAEGAYSPSLVLGEQESEGVDHFTAARISGGSWLDLHTQYSGKFSRWLKKVGFERSRHRLVVADMSNPLSVLAIRALHPSNTLVFAVLADESSTLLERSTSYVGVETALKRGFPVIAVSISYVDEATLFAEKGGLETGRQAVSSLLRLITSNIDDVMDQMGKDVKLGVKLHCFSAILAATDGVYPSFEAALLAQEQCLSLGAEKGDVETVYLTAFVQEKMNERVRRSFGSYRSRQLKSVLSAEYRAHAKAGNPELYDLLVLYGLKDGRTLDSLRLAYETVLAKVPELKVEDVA